MDKEYSWVKELKIGQRFKVYDNSFCFQLNGDKEEDVLLAPGTCYGENPYQLFIEKIVENEFIGHGFFRCELPVVYLKSKTTSNRYKVGVCWNRICAKLNGNIK